MAFGVRDGGPEPGAVAVELEVPPVVLALLAVSARRVGSISWSGTGVPAAAAATIRATRRGAATIARAHHPKKPAAESTSPAADIPSAMNAPSRNQAKPRYAEKVGLAG